MNSSTFARIEKEIAEDKETYLNNCRNNYSEYVAAAQKLFPNYYNSTDRLINLYSLNEKSLEFRKLGDTTAELNLLEEAVSKRIDTPYTYERISIIYSKLKDHNRAREICDKWFKTDYWKIPNMSTGSLRILHRLKRLAKKSTSA